MWKNNFQLHALGRRCDFSSPVYFLKMKIGHRTVDRGWWIKRGMNTNEETIGKIVKNKEKNPKEAPQITCERRKLKWREGRIKSKKKNAY